MRDEGGRSDESSLADGVWGDWRSVRIRKFTLGLEASPAQRLAWLEQAIRFAHSVGALPARRPTRSR